ncbi:MAG: hypothetical protein GXP19_05900 [Gammaproteobacteria bacterium]|nr:hypothetical protein [Gammaproteobacteria bacterium]
MSNDNRVIVTNIQMPFISMVVFMVKWAVAAIPALFILASLGSIFSTVVSNFLFGGQGGINI